jgi:hypothetical protein
MFNSPQSLKPALTGNVFSSVYNQLILSVLKECWIQQAEKLSSTAHYIDMT